MHIRYGQIYYYAIIHLGANLSQIAVSAELGSDLVSWGLVNITGDR